MTAYEVGVTAPPFHPWCRTTTAPYFADSHGERIARGADGEQYYVPADMKYAEWKEKFVKPAKEEVLKSSPVGAIIGVQTSTGHTVASIADHFTDSMTKRGFTIEETIDALTMPLYVTKITADPFDRLSQQFIGKHATIVYNPVTDVPVTGWRTGKSRLKKYGGGER
jgi:hypothetical protein